MTERLNVQPSPTTITVTGEVDGVPIAFESAAGSWMFFDPAPSERTNLDFMNCQASGKGEAFTVDEAVALVRVLVKVHRRAGDVASPDAARDSS
jgi:hypothetical protein